MKNKFYEITRFSFNDYKTYVLDKQSAINIFGDSFERSINANAWQSDLVTHEVEITGESKYIVRTFLKKDWIDCKLAAECFIKEWLESHPKKYYPMYKIEHVLNNDELEVYVTGPKYHWINLNK